MTGPTRSVCGAVCTLTLTDGYTRYVCDRVFEHHGSHSAPTPNGRFTWPKTLREHRP